MNIIQESASKFKQLEKVKYHFVFIANRKSHDIVLDFKTSDFRHASGLQHITDIVIEKNPVKLVDEICKNPPALTDEKLNESKKYKESNSYLGSIEQRVSDMKYLEECLDSSDYMRIYKCQPFGSLIEADYFIESYCKELSTYIYIFIRQRVETDTYVIVSFFRKKVSFTGDRTYWVLKEKITDSETIELYRKNT